MSVKVMAAVWDHSRASGTPLIVLLCLADWANDDGECWPSVSSIARKARLKDERHVKRIIHETLEKELGEVVVIPGGGVASAKGGLRSNRYRITVHLPAEIVAEQPLSETTDGGSPATIDGPDGGSPATQMVAEQPPLIVAEQPPEPSVRSISDPSLLAPALPAQRERARDPLFDALASVCGIDVSEITAAARGALNRALGELRAAGATPDSIRARAEVFRQRYSVTLTPSALTKHWPALHVGITTSGRRSQSLANVDAVLDAFGAAPSLAGAP